MLYAKKTFIQIISIFLMGLTTLAYHPSTFAEQSIQTTQKITQRIVQAIRYNNEKELDYLIREGYNLNAADFQGNTPLIVAASEKNRAFIEKILQYNVDINHQNRDGMTALMVAAARGDIKIVQRLIYAGANIHIKNNIDETALFEAIKNGHLTIVQKLIKHGADVNLQNKFRHTSETSAYTPLMFAVRLGASNQQPSWTAITLLLLKHGANPNTIRPNGETALKIAQRLNNQKMVALLNAQGANETISNYVGLTQNNKLIKASEQGDLNTVKQLIAAKLNINHRNRAGITPLLAATFNNHIEVVRFLVERGADINSTPLGNLQSLRASSAPIGTYPLRQAALRGDTALMVAARHGNQELTEYLLSKNALTSTLNKQGEDVTLMTASSGLDNILIKLLEHETDINAPRGGIWKAALAKAKAKELNYSVDQSYLLQESKITLLFQAAINGHASTVKLLLAQGANPNQVSLLGRTPLFWAAERGFTDVVELLLKQGADAAFTDPINKTPLMTAAQNGHHKIVELLLSANKNIYITEKNSSEAKILHAENGITALIYAARGGYADIVKQLLNAGALNTLQWKTESGATAMSEAKKNRHADVIALLNQADGQYSRYW